MRLAEDIRRHELFREFLGFGSTTLLEQVTRTVVNLVVAAHVGPASWGEWYLLNLVLRYGGLSHLGALNGMNRQYPLEIGRQRRPEAVLLRRASLGFVLITLAITIAAATGIVVLSGALAVRSVFLTLGLLGTQQVFTYAETSLKADTRFGDLSRAKLASALLLPVMVLPLAWVWGIDGFILGQGLALAAVTLVLITRDPAMFVPSLDARRSIRLVRIGLPIMLVGVLFALFTTVDRWVIVSVLDTRALGYYSLAIMALGAVTLFPTVLAQQFYPRMARAWGEREDWAEMGRLASRQGWLAFGSTLPIVVLGWLLAPPLIRAVLPAYVSGIGPMLITLAAPPLPFFGQGYANVLNVTDHQYRYMALILVSIGANAALSLALVRRFGLVGVGTGTLLAYASSRWVSSLWAGRSSLGVDQAHRAVDSPLCKRARG